LKHALVDACAHRELVPADTTPHTLRHTFATNYLKDHPGDPVGLAALLEHSVLETTRI
jgi:site-specific recombinase XerD